MSRRLRSQILDNIFPFRQAAWEGRWVILRMLIFLAFIVLLAYLQLPR